MIVNYFPGTLNFFENYMTCPERVDFPASTWPIKVILQDSLRSLSKVTFGFTIFTSFFDGAVSFLDTFFVMSSTAYIFEIKLV